MIDLKPIHSNQKSFHGKAKVMELTDSKILWSYDKPVTVIDKDGAFLLDIKTDSTLRHVKEFLLQNGFKADNNKPNWNGLRCSTGSAGSPPNWK